VINNVSLNAVVAAKISPYPTERGNVLYLLYGKRSGSKENQKIQAMRASASLSTPSVAASGATTVWGNGPTAPPYVLNICGIKPLNIP